MIVKCGKYHILFLCHLLKFSHTAAGLIVKKITSKKILDIKKEISIIILDKERRLKQ
jgi:hypothetical protein